MTPARPAVDGRFALMFAVMLTIAAANTALQSVLPALGRSLGVADRAVAVAFSVSGLLWVIAAPWWANRSDRHGRRAMILTGVGGFVVSLTVCGGFLAAGINGWIAGSTAFGCFVVGRMIYGGVGAAAPPAVQALVAGETTPDERTRALTLLASAFGLGTILGPAAAPYLRLGRIGGDFVVTGAGKSELEDLARPLIAAQGRTVAPEPNPERGGYYRSDHFSFAKLGVPMLDGGSGEDLVVGGRAAGHAAAEDYNQHRYHRPQDEYDPRWDWSGAVEDLTLYGQLGRKLADDVALWPNWYKGAEFRGIRDRDRAAAR